MGDIFQTIPGLREAVQRETNVRENAFLLGTIPERVAGFEVKPLSLTLYLLLEKIRSPFLLTGPSADKITPSPDATANALWILSANHRLSIGSAWNVFRSKFSRWLFFRRVGRSNYAAVVKGLRAYMEESTMDIPRGDGGPAGRIATTSYIAGLVDIFAVEYGWTRERVMDEPFKCLWQYQRRIRKRKDPKAVEFNKLSDRVKIEWQREVNAREQAERASRQ